MSAFTDDLMHSPPKLFIIIIYRKWFVQSFGIERKKLMKYVSIYNGFSIYVSQFRFVLHDWDTSYRMKQNLWEKMSIELGLLFLVIFKMFYFGMIAKLRIEYVLVLIRRMKQFIFFSLKKWKND